MEKSGGATKKAFLMESNIYISFQSWLSYIVLVTVRNSWGEEILG